MRSEHKGLGQAKDVSRFIIAIDGPSAAGKSTISRILAQRLGLVYINTGAMYRALAYKAAQQALDFNDPEALSRVAEGLNLTMRGEPDQLQIVVDGEDVTEAIRSPEISQLSSVASAVPGVRRAMVALQRALGAKGGVVLEGRDIGTQVFPNADLKVFLTANPEVRARRRWIEEHSAGHPLTLEQLAEEIRARDLRDQTRADSPLRRADDAVVIDTSTLGLEEAVEQIVQLVGKKVQGS